MTLAVAERVNQYATNQGRGMYKGPVRVLIGCHQMTRIHWFCLLPQRGPENVVYDIKLSSKHLRSGEVMGRKIQPKGLNTHISCHSQRNRRNLLLDPDKSMNRPLPLLKS